MTTECYQAAVRCFRLAADRGLVEAQYNLALCYEFGKGVTKDMERAVTLYRTAADRGLAEAQFNLGVCYAKGDVVHQDVAEAFVWFHKAAEQKCLAAMAYVWFSENGYQSMPPKRLTQMLE